MTQTYDNLLQLAERFDVFLLDAFGTFWDGAKLYPRADTTMAQLVDMGKTVCVVSNAPRHEPTKEIYVGNGLTPGQHCNYIFTSGMLMHQQLLHSSLPLEGKRVYIVGRGAGDMFLNTPYTVVSDSALADFIYLSTPRLTEEEYLKVTDKSVLFESAVSDTVRTWSSITLEPFRPKLQEILDTHLPVVNANPDLVSRMPVKHSDSYIFAIQNGSLATYLRQQGAQVLEFGKPHVNMFEFVLTQLASYGIKADNKSRICMVGDNLYTDILGANQAGISSVLCTETGVVAEMLRSGIPLAQLASEAKVAIDYTIRTVGC